MSAASYVRPHPTSPIKCNGREWGAVAMELVLTEGGRLMKVKTHLQAGQNNNFLNQAAAQAAGGGGCGCCCGGVIQQNLPAGAIQNQ
jgi:hypothetical protein